jgi:hypothetical protein
MNPLANKCPPRLFHATPVWAFPRHLTGVADSDENLTLIAATQLIYAICNGCARSQNDNYKWLSKRYLLDLRIDTKDCLGSIR